MMEKVAVQEQSLRERGAWQADKAALESQLSEAQAAAAVTGALQDECSRLKQQLRAVVATSQQHLAQAEAAHKQDNDAHEQEKRELCAMQTQKKHTGAVEDKHAVDLTYQTQLREGKDQKHAATVAALEQQLAAALSCSSFSSNDPALAATPTSVRVREENERLKRRVAVLEWQAAHPSEAENAVVSVSEPSSARVPQQQGDNERGALLTQVQAAQAECEALEREREQLLATLCEVKEHYKKLKQAMVDSRRVDADVSMLRETVQRLQASVDAHRAAEVRAINSKSAAEAGLAALQEVLEYERRTGEARALELVQDRDSARKQCRAQARESKQRLGEAQRKLRSPVLFRGYSHVSHLLLNDGMLRYMHEHHFASTDSSTFDRLPSGSYADAGRGIDSAPEPPIVASEEKQGFSQS
jgi:hypothetical protein